MKLLNVAAKWSVKKVIALIMAIIEIVKIITGNSLKKK